MDTRTGLPTVGMVGAGQLARMTHTAAIPLGLSLRVLASSPDDGAALVTSDVEVGDHTSLDDLRRFAKTCDVVTWDHEHVPNAHIVALAADGVDVQPGADALVFAQDKTAMRTKMGELGLPCPEWADLESADDRTDALGAFGERVGWPVVLKAARDGYDGKGVWVIDSVTDAADVLASTTPLLVEEKVAIARELAVDVARSPSGEVAVWPVVETVQRDGICVEVLAPAPGLAAERAAEATGIARTIVEALGVTGVLAVELFETTDGRLVVNELAMRPHNSGHWTIEGARTSQFQQHLRAVLDWPLGSTELLAPATVMVNVLGGAEDPTRPPLDVRLRRTLAARPDVEVHLYGKSWRPGRKVGHVTATGEDPAEVRSRARAAAQLLVEGDDGGS